ncbi:MAG: efflux RND transporter periplasmic adaptor subunit [Acidobacteriales bacterium]|nr:efflux RND transporter periplasmic adaptor subunit [Terriglobales bacterium]
MAWNDANSSWLARRRWVIWMLGIVAAIVILAAFMSMHGDVVPVHVATARREDIRSIISTNGKIEPLNNVEVHAPVGTTVKRVLVKEGDHVKKGQVIVELDDTQARQQAAHARAVILGSEVQNQAIQSGGTQEELLNAEAELTKSQAAVQGAQANLNALEQLQQKGAASVGEVASARANLARAQVDLNLVQQKQKERFSKPELQHAEAQQQDAHTGYQASLGVLQQLTVRAPFDGEVYWLPLHEGQWVNTGELLLQMADLTHVMVRAFVDEPEIGRLSLNQPVEVTWDAIPGRVWTGKVNSMPAVIKLRGTRNVGDITAVVDNAELKLLPNVDVGVAIVTAEHKNVLAVPREAVRQYDNKLFVFEVVNDQLQRRDVQTSISNLTDVEVSQGLQDNATVAVGSTNSKPLKGGLQVKVVR